MSSPGGTLVVLLLTLACFHFSYAQQKVFDGKVVQLSGYVSDSTTTEPISFITVRIKGSQRGMITNSQGFFSLPVEQSDTVLFTAIGYEPHAFIVPVTSRTSILVAIHMKPAIYSLRGLTIRAMTRERFKYELLTFELPPMPVVNPAAFLRPGELKLPPPPPGIHFSPVELIEDIPFVERAIKKKRSKKFVDEADPKDIPIMK